MEYLELQLPENVQKIITTLQMYGYEAYAVGGCVRDSLLNRTPGDWDITTSAMPEETKSLFDKTFDTGIEHGTVTVVFGREGYEVTTYRIDGEYTDSRHPREVTFTRSLKEDLLRRDFTINAMAYNDKDGLIDIFGGKEDLQRKCIRCVGNAKERFSEDALRILRGVRFAAQLGFDISEDTKEGMRELAPTLRNISAERIQVELVKMLTSDRPELLKMAWELKITQIFLPEFDRMMETIQETPHHMYNVGEHTLHAMDANGVAHFKKHAAESEKIAGRVLKRLKFDNDTLRKVTKLVKYHDYRMEATEKNVRRAMNIIGEELFPYYMEVRRADVLAQSLYKREEKIQNLDEIEELYRKIVALGQCVSLKTLAVNGSDLIAAGMKPGKKIGEKLEELLELVIDDPDMNTKEKLFQYLG